MRVEKLCDFCRSLHLLLRHNIEERPDALVFSRPRKFADLKAQAILCDLCKLMLIIIVEQEPYYKHGKVQDEEELTYSFPPDVPCSEPYIGVSSLCLSRTSAPADVIKVPKTANATAREAELAKKHPSSSSEPGSDLLFFHDPLRWLARYTPEAPARVAKSYVGINATYENLVRLDLMADDYSVPATKGRIVVRPISAIPDHPKRFEKALGWLAHCCDSHKICRQWQSSKLFHRPARLIEVSRIADVLSMRIVSASSSEAPYTTLSHCWGDLQPVRLLKENLSEFSATIPMEQIPSAFLDAAVVTMRLNCCYLWIDSLCILQNSADDWNTESAKMGDIYRGAVLTITTPDASTCHSGFLRPVQQPQNPLRLPFLDNETGTILPMTVCRGTPGAWMHRTADGDPVFSRGWILQEHLLSTRMLYSTRWGMLWECQEAVFDESMEAFLQPANFLHQYRNIRNVLSANMLSDSQPFDGGKGKSKASLPTLESFPSAYGSSTPRDVWFDVVEIFTERTLTEFKDRLPAISGIAKIFAMSFDSDYIAGLWKDDFISELAWSWSDYIKPQDCLTLDERMSRFLTPGQNFQAPSWSWASFPRTVTRSRLRLRTAFNVDGSIPVAFLEESTVEPRSHSDTFGSLSLCSVTVYGLLKRVVLHRYKNTSIFDHQEHDVIDVQDLMDEEALGWGCAVFDMISMKALEMFDDKVENDEQWFSTTYEGWPVYLLMLGSQNVPQRLENDAAESKAFDTVHESHRTSWNDMGRACSLIIAQAPGKDAKAIRLGICNSSHESSEQRKRGKTPRLGWFSGRVTLI